MDWLNIISSIFLAITSAWLFIVDADPLLGILCLAGSGIGCIIAARV